MESIKLSVPGKVAEISILEQNLPNDDYTLELVINTSTSTRATSQPVVFEIAENQLAEFVFDDGSRWLSGVNTLPDVFPDIDTQNRSSDLTQALPLRLNMPDEQRGLTDIILKQINLFKKKNVVVESINKLAKDLETKQLENKEGVFFITPGFELQKRTVVQSTKPYLLFIHGTASSTNGSFAKLYNSETWNSLCEIYGSQIIGLQHRTLSKDPLENVLDLIADLPKNINLHIVSHSRGGLIGDLLCRFCATENNEPAFSEDELNYWSNKANHHNYTQLVASITEKLTTKNITVSKFVRVACPAAGTTLASKRLDFYFNITLNLLGIITGAQGSLIYTAFKNLIGAIVNTKDNPDALPGLEVQNPDSAFIKVINHGVTSPNIICPLYIIAGNASAGLNFKAIAVIASRLFFVAQNDLVVNTASMGNGAKRNEDIIKQYFTEGTNVNHFNYFGNKATQLAIVHALQHVQGETLEGFKAHRQLLTEEALRHAALGLDGGQLMYPNVSGKKPIVIILPGIMGSSLQQNDKNIWINYLRFITGGLSKLAYNDENNATIQTNAIIKTSYGKLAAFLSNQYDVVTFAFDWRKSLRDATKIFADKINDLLKHNQPIKIVAHSMGGVLVRDFMIFESATWNLLQQSAQFKLIFLGSPLGGSYRIPYVLFGYDGIIKKLSKIDLKNNTSDLITIFCNCRGLLCLLPITNDPKQNFADLKLWQKLRDGLGLASKWPLPSTESLADFETYRNAILTNQHKVSFSQAVYIAGQDDQTPSGYKETDNKIEFEFTKEGDQSVTWESGIPQQIIALNNVYYSQASHGALSTEANLFPAISEILNQGYTQLLSKNKPQIRGEKQFTKAKDFDDFDISERGIEATILGLQTSLWKTNEILPVQQLEVRVSHGDIKYAANPVLAGHFKNDGLYSVEKAIDRHLNEELSKRLQLGLYPGDIGTYELLILNQEKSNSFPGAIILGLGKHGDLTAFLLAQTVEKGVAKYLTIFNTDKSRIGNDSGKVGISSPAISSGYGGLSIESSLRAILTGVQNANTNVYKVYGENAITIQELEFVDLYSDKTIEYVYSLMRIQQDANIGLHFNFTHKKIKRLLGNRERLPIDDTRDWWTRITVKLVKTYHGANEQSYVTGLQYNLSTDAAREEERCINVNMDTLQSLLDDLSNNNNWNDDLAKCIFELLIPYDFKEQLNKHRNIYWIVDKETAAFPWELLKNTVAGSKPLSISSSTMRQLATPDYRTKINPVISSTALIIADPNLEGKYPQLKGAYEEGKLVEQIFNQNEFDTTSVFNGSPGQILVPLFSKNYKIMHLSGHGLFSSDILKPSGMLIGPNAFITPAEINQMSTVPELVFVNCCYLGATNATTEKSTQSRYKLAANIGTQLIDIGVKAVVVAGWAIDDHAALIFAEVFYKNMFMGYNFGDAIRKAREAAYKDSGNKNNTWGAYQCYGDPFYVITNQKASTTTYGKEEYVMEKQAEVALMNLISKHQTGIYSTDSILEELQNIIIGVESAQLFSPIITELEATVYTQLGMYQEAMVQYESLLSFNKPQFSLAAIEQYCNIRAKYYAAEWHSGTMDKNLIKAGFNKVIQDLESLISIGVSSERLSMLGSTYKRYASLLSGVQQIKLIEASCQVYQQASTLLNIGNRAYPLCNFLAIQAMLVHINKSSWGANDLPAKSTATQLLREELLYQHDGLSHSMDFWDIMKKPNLYLVLYLLENTKMNYEIVQNSFKNVWLMAGTEGDKQTELEQLDLLIGILKHTKKLSTKGNEIKKELQALKAFLQSL